LDNPLIHNETGALAASTHPPFLLHAPQADDYVSAAARLFKGAL